MKGAVSVDSKVAMWDVCSAECWVAGRDGKTVAMTVVVMDDQ